MGNAKKKHKKKFGLYGMEDGNSCGSNHIRRIGNGIDEFYEVDGPDGAFKLWAGIIIVAIVVTIIGYVLTNM